MNNKTNRNEFAIDAQEIRTMALLYSLSLVNGIATDVRDAVATSPTIVHTAWVLHEEK